MMVGEIMLTKYAQFTTIACFTTVFSLFMHEHTQVNVKDFINRLQQET
jgi:hypothetical protein